MARRVYVSGPIRTGDFLANIRAGIAAGEALRRAGLLPFVPHAHLAWELLHGLAYEDWMAYDLGWVEACHALLRIPGESAGADREMAHARAHGLAIYYSVEECVWEESRICPSCGAAKSNLPGRCMACTAAHEFGTRARGAP